MAAGANHSRRRDGKSEMNVSSHLHGRVEQKT
jgi:hypothetical protein